jgi:hypothetical protein
MEPKTPISPYEELGSWEYFSYMIDDMTYSIQIENKGTKTYEECKTLATKELIETIVKHERQNVVEFLRKTAKKTDPPNGIYYVIDLDFNAAVNAMNQPTKDV